MNEFSGSPEQQIPPQLSEAEAQAALAAQEFVVAARATDADAQPREYVMGMTPDGTFVSVDERAHRSPTPFVVRTAKVDQLVAGVPLKTTELPYGFGGALRKSDGGTTEIMGLAEGYIFVPPAQDRADGRLPTFNKQPIFPIGADGRPYDPAQVAEQPKAPESQAERPVEPHPADVVVQAGRRGFFRRRR